MKFPHRDGPGQGSLAYVSFSLHTDERGCRCAKARMHPDFARLALTPVRGLCPRGANSTGESPLTSGEGTDQWGSGPNRPLYLYLLTRQKINRLPS